MSAVYAESSAVLRWLLDAPEASAVEVALASARSVVASALTPMEIGRTLQRLAAEGALDAAALAQVSNAFATAAAHWSIHAITDEVRARVTAPFPIEPVRTLDAIHVATAVGYAREVEPLVMVSVDARVRANAAALGLAVAP